MGTEANKENQNKKGALEPGIDATLIFKTEKEDKEEKEKN